MNDRTQINAHKANTNKKFFLDPFTETEKKIWNVAKQYQNMHNCATKKIINTKRANGWIK